MHLYFCRKSGSKGCFTKAFSLCFALLAMALLSACGSSKDEKTSAQYIDLELQQLLVSHMPKVWNPTPVDFSEVSFDGEIGVLRTQLEILFKSTATAADLDRVIASVDGAIVAAVDGVAAAVINIPDPVTLDALEAIKLELESDAAVWAVNRSEFPKPRSLPSTELPNGSHPEIGNHLAINASAAWNLRSAMTTQPTIIVVDSFGDGLPQGWDADLVADDWSYRAYDDTTTNAIFNDRGFVVLCGENCPDRLAPTNIHGYFVGGVAVASFGGDMSDTGRATGMYAKTAKLRISDTNGVGDRAAEYRSLQMAQAATGPSVINDSLGWHCEGRDTPECHEESRIKGGQWATKVRQAGLEDRVLIFIAAGNTDGSVPHPYMDTSHPMIAAGVRNDLIGENGETIPPLSNTLAIGASKAAPNDGSAPYSVQCMAFFSYLDAHLNGMGFNVFSTYNRDNTGFHLGTSYSSPQVAALAAMLWAVRPQLTVAEVKQILIDTARPTPVIVDQNCSSYATPPKTVDAFAAMLALDVSDDELKVRKALIDADGDRALTASDISSLLQMMDNANGQLDYGRADLNGDGYSGGNNEQAFDLNANGDTEDRLETLIGSQLVSFTESHLSDKDILCYLAFSIQTGSPGSGDSGIEAQCNPPTDQAAVVITNQRSGVTAYASVSYEIQDVSEQGYESVAIANYSDSASASNSHIAGEGEHRTGSSHANGSTSQTVVESSGTEDLMLRATFTGNSAADATTTGNGYAQYMIIGSSASSGSGIELSFDVSGTVYYRFSGSFSGGGDGYTPLVGIGDSSGNIYLTQGMENYLVSTSYSSINDGSSLLVNESGSLTTGSYTVYLSTRTSASVYVGEQEVTFNGSGGADLSFELTRSPPP